MKSACVLAATLSRVKETPVPVPSSSSSAGDFPPTLRDLRSALAATGAGNKERIDAALAYFAWITVLEEEGAGRRPDVFQRHPSTWALTSTSTVTADSTPRERFMVCAFLAALYLTHCKEKETEAVVVDAHLAVSELAFYQAKLLRGSIDRSQPPWSLFAPDEYEKRGRFHHLLALQTVVLTKRASVPAAEWLPLARYLILQADGVPPKVLVKHPKEWIALVWQMDVAATLAAEQETEAEEAGANPLDKERVARRLRQWLLVARLAGIGYKSADKDVQLQEWCEHMGGWALEAYRQYRASLQRMYLTTSDPELEDMLRHLPPQLVGSHSLTDEVPASYWGEDMLRIDAVKDIFPGAPAAEEPPDFGTRPTTVLQRLGGELDTLRLQHELVRRDMVEPPPASSSLPGPVTLLPNALPRHEFRTVREERLCWLGYTTHRLQTLQYLHETSMTPQRLYDKEIASIKAALDALVETLKSE